MKEYAYEHIVIKRFLGAKSEEHREIIDLYARQGYRYAGYIPTNINDYGKILEMDLIFERDI